jgi:hypothetical protein
LAGPAAAWTPGLNLSAAAGSSNMPNVARVAGSEALWSVWSDNSAGQWEVLGRQRPRAAEPWDDPLNLSDDLHADEGAVLYADSQGRLHLAWTRRDASEQVLGTQLLYRQWADGVWSPAVVIDDDPDVHIPSPYGLFFCQDAGSTLWLFLNLGSGVSHTRLQAGGWDPLSPWAYVTGMQGMGAIIAGSDGLFHVAALGKNEGNLGGPYDPFLEDAYYATTDGTTWSPLVNLAMTGTVAFDLGLAWDESAALHLLWTDIHPMGSVDSEKSAVYERILSGGSWSERVELTRPNVDQAVEDLAVLAEPDGSLHLAWSEGVFSGSAALDLSIRYLHWETGRWGIEETVFTSTLTSMNVDVALGGPLGEPAVVWEEGPALGEEAYFSERQLLLPFRVFVPLVQRSP